jgi:mannose-6-phosphate isomerase-like protein (cupin superfamily)
MARTSREVARISDSELTLERREIEASSVPMGDGEADTLLFVASGAGSIALGAETAALDRGSAALVLAGEQATVSADSTLDLVVMAVGTFVDRHAPFGPRALTASLEDADALQATASRAYRILFDPTNGSTRATLFAGFLPPGKAPWHYHLYDEIVWVPEGPGRLHVGTAVEDLEAQSAFRLRPREVHIVENTSSDQELTIIGLFTPAGSPSAAYLTADVAAEYRIDAP